MNKLFTRPVFPCLGSSAFLLLLLFVSFILVATKKVAAKNIHYPTPEVQGISLEKNLGQIQESVNFIVRQGSATVFLTDQSMVFQPRHPGAKYKNPVQITFENAQPITKVSHGEKLPGVVNYLQGHRPKQWLTEVPTFSRARYHSLYPGIDVEFYGNQGRLEYDFILAPGADVSAIQLGVSGDITHLEIDPLGALSIEQGSFKVKQLPPHAYQDVGGLRQVVSARYQLANNQISIALGEYDRGLPLIIDPIVTVFSTYLGGRNHDEATAITVDNQGNTYVTGKTESVGFPTADALQGTLVEGNQDIFITKFSPDGSTLIFSTYLGGANADAGADIALDSSGNIVLTGVTASEDFPTHDAIQNTLQGIQDAFVIKLDSAGSAILFSTYLGGSSGEYGHGIAVDNGNDIYVMGFTNSDDFPTLNPAQSSLAGNRDVFVSKLESDGSKMIYGTYIGGSNDECFNGIGSNILCRINVDSRGFAIVAGTTQSNDFPIHNALQATNNSGGVNPFEGFVSKLLANGGGFVYSTYLGGSGSDSIRDVAIDSMGNAYVVGQTSSDNFPVTPGAFQSVLDTGQGLDAFITKLNSAGSQLLYSTLLGGTGAEISNAISLSPDNRAVVSGTTNSADFPTLSSLQDFSGSTDIFITAVNPGGNGIVFSSYFGGPDIERINDLATRINVDENMEVYIAGFIQDGSYPTRSPLQANHGGGRDAVVSKFEFQRPELPYEYAAKVICGRQADRADMRLARGFYASTINIHSPNREDIIFLKKLALSHPPAAQQAGQVFPIATHELHYGEAIALDCMNINQELFKGALGSASLPYIEGFAVVQSSAPLDVTAVYTTATLDQQNNAANHSSLHMEQIKQRFTGLDLKVTKTAKQRICGEQQVYSCWVLFEIQINNLGLNNAHNVVITDRLNGPVITEEGALAAGVPAGPLFTLVPGVYQFTPVNIGSLSRFNPSAVPQEFELSIPELQSGESASFQFWAYALGLSPGHPLLNSKPPALLRENLLIDTVTVSASEVDTNKANNQFILEVGL